jgi:hypothetical protein
MAQVALAWIGRKVTSPIVGFSSVKRLEEAIIPGKTLTDEEIKHLEEPCVMLSALVIFTDLVLQVSAAGDPGPRISVPY